MKNISIRGVLLVSALFAPLVLRATTATSLSDFGGIEEPQVIYHPAAGTFTSDSFVNITDLGGGTFQMLLRYSTTQWDGDRTTSNTDRGRAEIKTLGAHQLIHETYDYTTTWRTNPEFVGSGDFCHITQLKPVDGVEGSSGAPMITTSIFSGTNSAAIRYASASFSPANVFTPRVVRNITWAPNTWLTQQVRVTTTADGETTGQVLVSLNGDSFQGVTGVEVCRPSTTEYYPKWGLYRGTSTTSGFSPNDYIQHSNVSTNKVAVADPAFSPAGGTYTSAQTVAITSATGVATIRYTLDGSTPSETNGAIYVGPLSVGSTTTLQAIAYATGYVDSNVTSATYTINLPHAAAPTFNPTAGTYNNNQTVTIASTTSGASIRYTTDGSAPSKTNGTLYSGPVTVSGTTTLQAIAYATGYIDSTVSIAPYTLQCAPVAFNPAAGTYTTIQNVALSTATQGATIRYTTDGSTPSETAGTIYSGTITLSATTTVKAIAYKTNYVDSAVSSAVYTINLPSAAAPIFSPGTGTYTSTQTVTISSATSGASIRYTTDGSTPSETVGTIYSSPVSVSSSKTLKAIAYKSGFIDSTVTSATYTINAAPPTLNFEAENLTYTPSGATASVQTDTNSSGGKWIELAGNSTGDYINFTVTNVPAGTYQVKMEWKGNNNRGILQLSVDGTNLGSKLDQYASGQTYPTTTFGNVTFSSAGNHTIRLTVTGKNSSSSGEILSADKFTLVGQ